MTTEATTMTTEAAAGTIEGLVLTSLKKDSKMGRHFYRARTMREYGAAVREAAEYLPDARVLHINPNYACISYLADGKRAMFIINRV